MLLSAYVLIELVSLQNILHEFFRLEDHGKEGNGKYEQCPVEDYVFKLEIIQCLLESQNSNVICEDSKLDFAKRKT